MYQTKASDRYYLDKVRRGLITPQDPERDWENEYIQWQREFIEYINAHLGEWFQPALMDYGPCEYDQKFLHMIKVMRLRGYPGPQIRRWAQNRRMNEYLFEVPVTFSHLPEGPGTTGMRTKSNGPCGPEICFGRRKKRT